MFANACSKQGESPSRQSESLVASGLKRAATEAGRAAAERETKSATAASGIVSRFTAIQGTRSAARVRPNGAARVRRYDSCMAVKIRPTLDARKLRADFPIFEQRFHGK